MEAGYDPPNPIDPPGPDPETLAGRLKVVGRNRLWDAIHVLLDPFGHVWTVMTHMEDLSAEELEERFLDIVAQQFEEDS